MQDQAGTIETLERQLVQAGIKNKVMQANVEVQAEKERTKSMIKDEGNKTQLQEKLLRDSRDLHIKNKNKELNDVINNEIKVLRDREKERKLENKKGVK